MKTSLTILLIVIANSLLGQSTYTDSIELLRQEHITSIENPSSSILTSEELAHFKGLAYFDVDTNFLLTAHFKKDIGKKFKMPTSTERQPIYRRYGYIEFTVAGNSYQLTVYQNMELRKKEGYKDYLFLPFRDGTSGSETYGGGRYLDLRIPDGKHIIVDFNLAYNPYCAYSYRYSCPIPPQENTLEIPIPAGEKYVPHDTED